MIAHDARHLKPTHNLNAFPWVGIVADDIAEADKAIAMMIQGILNHRLERFDVAMDVADQGVFVFRSIV